MAYVPVYLTAGDDCGGSCHTTSQKGTVNKVWCEVNTHFGQAVRVTVKSDGEEEKIDEGRCVERISHWAKKENKKKVEYWQEKHLVAIRHNKIAKESEGADIYISAWNDNKVMNYWVNNTKIDEDSIAILNLIMEKKWRPLLAFIESKIGSRLIDLVVSEEV